MLTGLKVGDALHPTGHETCVTSAVLMNKSGKVTAPAIPKTVSALLGLEVPAREIFPTKPGREGDCEDDE